MQHKHEASILKFEPFYVCAHQMLAKKLFTIDIDRETRATLNVKNENINNRPFHDLLQVIFLFENFQKTKCNWGTIRHNFVNSFSIA